MEIKTSNILNNLDSSFDIKIRDSGYAVCQNEWCGKIVTPPYSRIYYTFSGDGEIIGKEEIIRLEKDTICLIPINYSFSYKCGSSNEQLYFHLNLINSEQFDLLSCIKKPVIMKTDLNRLMMIKEMYFKENFKTVIKLKGMLFDDIYALIRKSNEKIEIKNYSESVTKILEYISLNLSASLSIKEISENLYLSPSSISHKFKKETGISVNKYILNSVLFNAEKLLLKKNLTVNEISNMLGFYDQFYFSKKFKEKFGVSPKKYQNIIRKP